MVRLTGPERRSVEHRVVERADRARRLAARAIPMVPPCGRAWLPLQAGSLDRGGFRADRIIVTSGRLAR